MNITFTRAEAFAVTVECAGEERAKVIFNRLADDYIFYANEDLKGFSAHSDTDFFSGWEMDQYMYR